jgi:phage shock protein E
MEIPNMHASLAAARPLFIDVRSPGEFSGGYLDGAINLPLDLLPQRIAALAPDLQQELVLYCASGARSAYACALLQRMGYVRARNGGGIGALALSSLRPVRRA